MLTRPLAGGTAAPALTGQSAGLAELRLYLRPGRKPLPPGPRRGPALFGENTSALEGLREKSYYRALPRSQPP